MATPPRMLLLLLLLLCLGGSGAHPALPRPPRHSDGAFTSELSRLRESARLQRLLQGLVGKRSEPDPEAWTAWTRSARGHFCVLRPDWPALDAWAPRRDPLGPAWSALLPRGPRSRPEVQVSESAAPRLRGPS